MTEKGPDFSRSDRMKKQKRSSVLLNSLIGVVVLLIIIVTATIILKDDENEIANEKDLTPVEKTNTPEEDINPIIEDVTAPDEVDQAEEDDAAELHTTDEESDVTEEKAITPESEAEAVKTKEKPENSGSVTYIASDDDIISETIISAAWRPIGTTQTGEHASLYDPKSVDWEEKEKALAYAAGLSRDAMIFWRIGNGGSPQKSIGIVSSKDKVEKYRVYLEWTDGEGWKPVKMDVLKTLDFEY